MSDDLLDTAAVAALLGVATASIRRMRQPDRPGPPFPSPVRHYGRTPVFRRSDIEAWAASRPGRTGRPRKDTA